MARITKADLENRIAELEQQLTNYQKWLMESEEKYNNLVEKKESQLESLPEYQQMKNRIEQLELIKKLNEDTIKHKDKTEKVLREKINKLQVENKEFKTIHNARGAGRKPMSEEKVMQLENLVKQGQKKEEICKILGISRATYYRIKKSL